MFCSKCGQKLNDGDLFCSKCGNRVASAPDTPVTPDEPEKSGTPGTSGISETSGTPETPVAVVTPVTPSAEPVTPVAEPVTPVDGAASTEAPPEKAQTGADMTPPPPEKAQTGADMTPPPPEKSPDGKSRLAYQVLALSFGLLGLHNFYARRILPACAQILLTAAAIVLCITQGVFWTWFLPVAAWCIIEIFAVRKDGKGIPWGENFASAPGIESIDAMVLAKFSTNSRRCIAAFFLALILSVVASSAAGMSEAAGVAFDIVLLCLMLMPWYYHARSKGYAARYSIVLALLGFSGIVMFIVGAGFVVKRPFSLLTGGNIFLSGILLPIAAFKVARRILLKNGFKALSPAKKALTIAAIVGSLVLAVAGAGFACKVVKDDEAAGQFNRSDEAEKQFNRGVALMKNEEFADAVRAFRIAAERGMPEAQLLLGACYYNGKGVERDVDEAVRWTRKAAEQGYAEAQCSLGCAYADGNGVDKDMAEAVRWFRKAAKEGCAGAQLNLGRCYATGKGVKKDKEKAAKWIRKAAEQGLAEAQWAMAGCYAGGEGVEKDMGEAVRWARKAARQGHPIAKKALKELGESEE